VPQQLHEPPRAADDIAIREVQRVEAIYGGERLDIGVEDRTLWGDPARRR
jgi:hypothetical protein